MMSEGPSYARQRTVSMTGHCGCNFVFFLIKFATYPKLVLPVWSSLFVTHMLSQRCAGVFAVFALNWGCFCPRTEHPYLFRTPLFCCACGLRPARLATGSQVLRGRLSTPAARWLIACTLCHIILCAKFICYWFSLPSSCNNQPYSYVFSLWIINLGLNHVFYCFIYCRFAVFVIFRETQEMGRNMNLLNRQLILHARVTACMCYVYKLHSGLWRMLKKYFFEVICVIVAILH